MDNKEKTIVILRENGPSLPSRVSSSLGIDTFFAGALLSELLSDKKIRISTVKVGGSPLYYLPEDARKLVDFSDRLNEKDKRAYDLLKERKILRDDSLTALLRVSLRSIKDFAVPLRVGVHGETLIFWKWFLFSSQEAEQKIKSLLNLSLKKEDSHKEEAQQRLTEDSHKKEVVKPEVKTQSQEIKASQTKHLPSKNDAFFDKITSFFGSSRVKVLSYETIRKNGELDFLIEVPSSIGSVNYYCKAKNKKKVNHNDLSTAFVQGQIKKLPVLFITTGTLTKKAEEMLSDEFKNLVVKSV